MVPALLLFAAATCAQPWSAIDVARTLERQGVGREWKAVPQPPEAERRMAMSKPSRAIVMTFGCQGDYLDELAAEDREIADGDKLIRFQNDGALALVVFYRPVTAAEGAVTRATLANLTP